MKKLIVMMALILGCFGCQARYNLVINEDLTVEESITGLETNEFFNRYTNSSKSRVINFVMATKENYLKQQQYSIEHIDEDDLSGAVASKVYKDLDDYANNSKAYGQYYDNWNYENNDGVITFETLEWLPGNRDSIDRYYIEQGTVVSIKLPFKVLENNADSYDRRNKIYKWNLDYDEPKEIYLKFDTHKTLEQQSRYILWAVAIGVILAGVAVALFIFLKNKKHNKF